MTEPKFSVSFVFGDYLSSMGGQAANCEAGLVIKGAGLDNSVCLPAEWFWVQTPQGPATHYQTFNHLASYPDRRAFYPKRFS